MNKNYFVTSASPFVRTVNKTNFIMLHVIIALLPSLICASITLGSRVIVFALLNIFWCVMFELSANIIFKKQATIGDLSAVVSGLILTMLTPVGVSYWFTIASAFLAMFVAKFLFGGIGKNIFNPSAFSRLIMLLIFGFFVQGFNQSTMISNLIANVNAGVEGFETLTLSSLLFGFKGAIIGETSALALLLGGIYLMCVKVVDYKIPCTFIVSFLIFGLLLSGLNVLAMPYAVINGSFMLGAFFMLPDYSTSPVLSRGKMIYSFLAGFLVAAFSAMGFFKDAVILAVVIVNCFVPLINKLNRHYETKEEENGKKSK